jgi:hypothetical protein
MDRVLVVLIDHVGMGVWVQVKVWRNMIKEEHLFYYLFELSLYFILLCDVPRGFHFLVFVLLFFSFGGHDRPMDISVVEPVMKSLYHFLLGLTNLEFVDVNSVLPDFAARSS